MPGRRTGETWERWVEEALRGRHLHEPSRGALREAIALGGRLPSTGARQWLARLIFDSAAEPLPVGVRGSSVGERRLLFELRRDEGAETTQLDVRLRREPRGTIEITGQVLPPISEAWIEARVASKRRRQPVGRDGEFLFRGLPGGAGVRLKIHREGREPWVVEEITLPLASSD